VRDPDGWRSPTSTLLDPLKVRLEEHGVIDAVESWTGRETQVWFLGDYVDRGSQGLEVVALVRQLEQDAPRAGGSVKPLLGNHELQFLAALHFGDAHLATDGGTAWRTGWLRYGGVAEELSSVDEAAVDWMTRLPLVDRDGDDLFVHSDTDAYLQLGRTVEDINAAGREILTSRDPVTWAMLHRVLPSAKPSSGRVARRPACRARGPAGGARSHQFDRRLRVAVRRGGGPSRLRIGRAIAVDGGVFEGGALLVAELDRPVAPRSLRVGAA
jgi:hypothetical protein